MQNGMPLRVENLEKSYKKRDGTLFSAVKGISFEVKAGECFGLLGPNGAGKSTTIHCISGFYAPSAGRVFIEGHDSTLDPKMARQYFGLCAQLDTLDTDFGVLDQMVRHATFFGYGVKESKEKAITLLRKFGLADKMLEDVEALSGGMRRRLQVARALMSDPKVLVLDEPTTGLDPEARRIVWDILHECRASGIAVLLCTHYMEEAERLCDRIAILSKGKILAIDSPSALITKHMGDALVKEEVRPGVVWNRPPTIEDVYLKLTSLSLRDGVLE